ncbi:MAG: hypothetical protein ACMUEL_01375 [Flavobacteriales bacterium Tduv]
MIINASITVSPFTLKETPISTSYRKGKRKSVKENQGKKRA